MTRQHKLPEGMWQRGKTYFARFRANGREVRKRLSTDFRVACELLRDLRARADRADFGLIDNDFSLEDLRRQWLDYCKQTLRPRTVKRYRQNLNNVFAGISCSRVSQLDVEVMTAYRKDRLAKEPTPRTINMEVGVFQRC